MDSLEKAISGDDGARELVTGVAAAGAIISVGAYYMSQSNIMTAVSAASGVVSTLSSIASSYMHMVKSESPFCVCMWDPVLEMHRRNRRFNLKVNAKFDSQQSVNISMNTVGLTTLTGSSFIQQNVQKLIEEQLRQDEGQITVKMLLMSHMDDLNSKINTKYVNANDLCKT